MKSKQLAVSTATTQTIRHSVEELMTVYTTVIRPTLEYACPAWSTSLTLGLQSDIERVQRRAINIIYPNTPYAEAFANAQLTSLKQRRAQLCEHFSTHIEQPQHKLHKLLPKARATTHNTRSRTRYSLYRVKTNRSKACFINWCLFNQNNYK